jgi:hypothetical protein
MKRREAEKVKVPKFKLRLVQSSEKVRRHPIHTPKVLYDRRSEKDLIEIELKEYEQLLREEQEEFNHFFSDGW